MKKCDLAQDAAAKIRAANIAETEANDQAIEQDFELEAEPKIENTILRKLASIGDQQMTEEEFNKHYGSNEQRKKLADKLWIILKGHPHLAPTMQEEFKFRLANVGRDLPKDVIKADEFGQKHIVFDKLPTFLSIQILVTEFDLPLCKTYNSFPNPDRTFFQLTA